MKKLLRFLTVALVAGSVTCQAVDYANHYYNQRVYRVALGSGTAPSAADMNTVRLHNGDMVLNTDDDVLYIMQATNVYTKIDAAGALTVGTVNGVTINTTMITNVIAAGQVLPAVSGIAITNIGASNMIAGTSISAVNGLAITNINAANLKAATIVSAIDGSAITNIASAGIAGLSAAKLTVATVATAISGAAITNITAANIASAGAALAITNKVIIDAGSGVYVTNNMVFHPFAGGYILKSSTLGP